MPNYDASDAGATSSPLSSGQTQPAAADADDAHSQPNAGYASTSNSAHTFSFSAPHPHHDSADHHDDATGTQTKPSRSRPSDTLRRSQACLACRKRKLRCDARKPTCSRCEKAWLAYHPSEDGASSSTPPPCEYDTPLLARFFKRSSSSDTSNTPSAAIAAAASSSSQASGSRTRDIVHEGQNEQLWEENEQLRGQVSYLQRQLQQIDECRTPATGIDSTSSRSRLYSTSGSASASASLSRVSVQHLIEDAHGIMPPSKRMKPSDSVSPAASRSQLALNQSAPHIHTPLTRRDDSAGSSSLPWAHSSTDTSVQRPGSASTPSVFRAPASSSSSWAALPHYSNEANTRSPTHRPSSAHSISLAPSLPNRQALNRIIDVCQRDAWLFAAINGYALSDFVTLLDATPATEPEHVTARALLSATIAIGLPLLVAGFPKSISASSTIKSIDDSLRSHMQLVLPRVDDPSWVPAITKLYADGARDLVTQAQAKSGGNVSPATFVIHLVLAEVSLAQSCTGLSQADLASAASEARLLHLHTSVAGTHPRISTGPTRNSHLSRALRGLMQTQQESHSFWSLFLLDCFQSRLARLPVMIERQSIRMLFPRRIEADSATSSVQYDLEQVEAYMRRRRGLPVLDTADTSMSLLVKVSLVLDHCCDYAITSQDDAGTTTSPRVNRNISLQQEQERGRAFLAAHESIRNSRMMLSNFDDRSLARPDMANSPAVTSARSREILVSTLVLQDQCRFAAEVTHHLAVLSLFETRINVADLSMHAGEARNMIVNAAVWLSRLAGMALQRVTFLFALPSFCSQAFFIAARWLLFLQGVDPDQFHGDISTLVLALSKRAECYSRDCKYFLLPHCRRKQQNCPIASRL